MNSKNFTRIKKGFLKVAFVADQTIPRYIHGKNSNLGISEIESQFHMLESSEARTLFRDEFNESIKRANLVVRNHSSRTQILPDVDITWTDINEPEADPHPMKNLLSIKLPNNIPCIDAFVFCWNKIWKYILPAIRKELTEIDSDFYKSLKIHFAFRFMSDTRLDKTKFLESCDGISSKTSEYLLYLARLKDSNDDLIMILSPLSEISRDDVNKIKLIKEYYEIMLETFRNDQKGKYSYVCHKKSLMLIQSMSYPKFNREVHKNYSDKKILQPYANRIKQIQQKGGRVILSSMYPSTKNITAKLACHFYSNVIFEETNPERYLAVLFFDNSKKGKLINNIRKITKLKQKYNIQKLPIKNENK